MHPPSSVQKKVYSLIFTFFSTITSPLYEPHSGHTLWDKTYAPHLGQGLRFGTPRASCDLLILDFDLDFLLFGNATAGLPRLTLFIQAPRPPAGRFYTTKQSHWRPPRTTWALWVFMENNSSCVMEQKKYELWDSLNQINNLSIYFSQRS